MIKINNEVYEHIKQDYLEGISFKMLEEKYGIKSNTLYNKLKKDDIINRDRKSKRYKNYDCEPYLTFKKMYLQDKLSIYKIAEIHECSICKVQRYLEKFNLTRNNNESKQLMSRNNIINSDFFKNIDTEEKAYWLGFIMADGNINKNGYNLKIELNIKDKEHIKKFSDIFNLDISECNRYDKRTNKIYNSVTCQLTNVCLINDLKSLGMSSNKTHSLNSTLFYYIPYDLKRHFIRGYFDGDGTTDGRRISFVSCSKDFLINIGNYINEELNIEDYTIYEKENYLVITWYKKENVNKFKDYFYDNATIYLQRKLDKILKVQNNPNKKERWKDEEILLLKTLIKEDFNDKDNIVNLFPNRTFNSIYRKYKRVILYLSTL